jgi:hypothetical protein
LQEGGRAERDHISIFETILITLAHRDKFLPEQSENKSQMFLFTSLCGLAVGFVLTFSAFYSFLRTNLDATSADWIDPGDFPWRLDEHGAKQRCRSTGVSTQTWRRLTSLFYGSRQKRGSRQAQRWDDQKDQ